jgi:ribosomal protein S18 acetylase RimI-like enzyme
MLETTVVTNTNELDQILTLQQKNLKQHIDASEKQQQGFVTVHHTKDVLQQMHNMAPSIIAKDNDKVVGYALTMLNDCRQLIPILEPMYANFENLQWKNKPLFDYRFYVMGQVCIDKEYRGMGLFDQLYQQHRDIYQHQYDFMVTEVSVSNPRSLRAHLRVGFEVINIYHDAEDEWNVIVWDWR